jgi:peptidoglycan L-alanyl-D-glutamate endopeptidase CwlK
MNQYFLGRTSRRNLYTCSINIQKVIFEAISRGLIDFSVIEGIRGKAEQNRYFKIGKSKVEWPNSKHNVKRDGLLSLAVDLVPYVNGKSSYDVRHCCYLAGIIISVAASMGIVLRWGGNWDMDGEPITDQDFQDLVHYEEIK